jgi:hypothetical protein
MSGHAADMKTIIGLFGFELILISNLIAQESGAFIVPEYPVIIPHSYGRSITTEANGKMYVWTGGPSWHWACYPEQWKLFSNGKGYEVNTGK